MEHDTPSGDAQARTDPRRISCLATAVVVVFVGIVALCGGAWWVMQPVIPANTLKQIRGATRGEVRRILGEPSTIQAANHWIYERPLNPGYVSIYFDGDDRVYSINDEQVDPVTFGSGSWTNETLLPKSE